MKLGIKGLKDQLQIIDKGGLYILDCTNSAIAINLTLFSIIENKENSSHIFIDDIELENFYSEFSNPNLIPNINASIYKFKNSKNIFKSIINDFFQFKITKEQDIIYIILNKNDFCINENHILHFFDDLFFFAKSNNLSIVTVLHGNDDNSVLKSLLLNNVRANGIASIYPYNETYILQFNYWKGASSSTQANFIELTLNCNGFSSVGTNKDIDLSSTDKGDFYIHSLCDQFTPDNNLYNNTLKFETNEKLYEHAIKHATAATIMFFITDRIEIDKLGFYIYDLRVSRGNQLVILLLEFIDGIRANTERFLLSCGANFIFPKNVTVTYIQAMLQCFYGRIFTRIIPTTYDELIEKLHFIENQPIGHLTVKEFKENVKKQLSGKYLGIRGQPTLIVLTPISNLDMSIVVNQLHPLRKGDVFCIIKNELALFLPSCTSNEIKLTINRIFSVPLEKLFESYYAYYKDSDIFDELERWDNDIKNESVKYKLIQMLETKNEEMQDYLSGIKTIDDVVAKDKIEPKEISLDSLRK